MNRQILLNSIAVICNLYDKKKFPADGEEPKLWLSPVVGLLPGLIIAVLSSAFVFLMGNIGGGILSAILFPLFLEILTGGRGLEATVSFLNQLISGKRFSEAVVASGTGVEKMQSQILFASVYVFRMAVFGLIAARGSSVWFLFVLGGAYLIRGEILSGDTEDPEAPRWGNWLVYIITCLAAALLSFHIGAIASFPIALILTALLLLGIRRFLQGFSVDVDFAKMELVGCFAENILFRRTCTKTAVQFEIVVPATFVYLFFLPK